MVSLASGLSKGECVRAIAKEFVQVLLCDRTVLLFRRQLWRASGSRLHDQVFASGSESQPVASCLIRQRERHITSISPGSLVGAFFP